jgi:hypothetical protein
MGFFYAVIYPSKLRFSRIQAKIESGRQNLGKILSAEV